MVADSPAAERDRAEPPMKHLDVSAPQTLSASYLIPLAAPMTGAEVQRRITRAVGTRLTGPLKTLVLQWADQGAVSV